MGKLTAAQVTSVKRALDAFEEKVRSAMRAAVTESREQNFANTAGEVHDQGDESVAGELMALNSALAERHSHELLEIERARQRIAEGVAGVCAECAGDIGVPRLMANPIAERCIDCESKREQTHAHPATPSM